jgi:hypothetical protein
MGLTLRRDKGSALTHDELDDWVAPELAQTSHGLAVGDLVYRSSATAWSKAIATAEATLAEGIVVNVEDVDNLSVVTIDGSVITLAAHGLGAVGTVLYLDQSTAGDIATSKPSDGFRQMVGKIISADEIIFRLGPLSEFI